MIFSNLFLVYLYITCILGYTLVLLHDYTQLGKVPRLLRYGTLLGYPLTLAPFVIIPMHMHARVSPALVWMLGAAASLFFGLLVYSVCIEVRLFAPEKPGTAWKGGTYRFSRHPGFLWFTAMHIIWMIIFSYAQVVLLLAVCIFLNLIVITAEDRWIFPRLFTDYHEYQKEVPFIL